jgi:hypothetical protein
LREFQALDAEHIPSKDAKMKTKGGDKRVERKTMVWLIAIIAVVGCRCSRAVLKETAGEEQG